MARRATTFNRDGDLGLLKTLVNLASFCQNSSDWDYIPISRLDRDDCGSRRYQLKTPACVHQVLRISSWDVARNERCATTRRLDLFGLLGPLTLAKADAWAAAAIFEGISMPISRRTVIANFGLAPAAMLLPRTAFANYPDRPIRLIVPFAAGGNADIVGRLVGERISSALGQPVVVDNRGGAGGSLGAEAVARSAPDGYTLVGSNGPLSVNPFVQAKLGYDPLKDFALILNNNVKAKNITALIALSKKAQISIATSGIGSATHMTLERFKAAIGANLVHVPYRSGGALMPDLFGGSIQAAMTEARPISPRSQRAIAPNSRLTSRPSLRAASRTSPRKVILEFGRAGRSSSVEGVSRLDETQKPASDPRRQSSTAIRFSRYLT